ncbi:MAG: LPS assembly protein LptD [Verrucomicrobiota bacterium]
MRSWGRILLPVWVALSLGTAALAADSPSEPAIIDAQELNFDKAANLAHGKGDVVVRYQGSTVRADQAKFNTLTKEIWAEGNVRINRDGQEWVAPAAYYNFETRMVKADVVRGVFEPVYVRGEQLAQVASNQYTLARATLTTCDYQEPHYRIQATHAEIYPQDRIVLFNCTLWLHSVPVFWLPVMTWSLIGDNHLFTLAVGNSSDWGFFELLTTHWRLNKNIELALHTDERTSRGPGVGADVNYKFGENIEGQLRGYYIDDSKPRQSNDIPPGEAESANRYLGEWQHKQTLPDNVTVTVDLNKQSDTNVVRNFFPVDYRRNSEPSSVADVTKRGENYTLSILTRPQFNSFYAEVERLPEVTWAVNRTRLGPSPIFYEGVSSVGYYNNEAAQTGDPLFTGSATRLDTVQQLLMPETLFGWLAFVPRASGRYTYYSRAPDSADTTSDVQRYVGNLGAELSFKVSQTWPDVQNKRFAIDGLRHILQPFADYSWIPTPNVNSNQVFQFDTPRSTTLDNGELLLVTRYQPLQFPAFNTTDGITRQDTLRFGLRQKLQTRRDGQPWDLLEVTGWTDYHIEQVERDHAFGNLFGTVEARPTDWLTFNDFVRYDFNAGVVRELNTEARVNRGDKWAVGLGTRYLKDDSNQIAGTVSYRLSRRWVAQMYQRFEMQDGQWEEQDYVLRQELHDWFIAYGFRYRSERTKSDEKAVFFSFTLKAFPGVQLGFNEMSGGN